jgi:hypothetical protein
MKVHRGTLVRRDQEPSVFSAILARLCEASSALGAALVDGEGETVDYAGRIEPFELRVSAAELRIVLATLQATSIGQWNSTHELLLRCAKHSFAVRSLTDGYALVLVLPRFAFRVSRRALAEAAFDLERESGLSLLGVKERLRWLRVDVRASVEDEDRPQVVWYQRGWRPVTLLGRFQSADLEPEEVGYLARFATGPEVLLVRESRGMWFAGEPA